MPLDPHDRQDDDMGRLGLQTGMFGTSYQSPPLGKFNHTSHATPPPAAVKNSNTHGVQTARRFRVGTKLSIG